VIAEVAEPRAAFYFAGASVLVTVIVAAPLLRRRWPDPSRRISSMKSEPGDDVVLELIPVK
jgi:hypothetical protein